MINYVRGNIIDSGVNYVTLDVGGVGYKIFTSTGFLESKKGVTELALWCYLAVREDALDLYGFPSKDELTFFEMLIGISGIGPKSALSILNVAPVSVIRQAALTQDSTYLSKMTGIGRKTAEKVVLGLKDTVLPGIDIGGAESSNTDTEVVEALVALGYSEKDARDAVRSLSKDGSQSLTSDRLKEALRHIGKHK
jgi:holliday junction DNA helicase RuvA